MLDLSPPFYYGVHRLGVHVQLWRRRSRTPQGHHKDEHQFKTKELQTPASNVETKKCTLAHCILPFWMILVKLLVRINLSVPNCVDCICIHKTLILFDWWDLYWIFLSTESQTLLSLLMAIRFSRLRILTTTSILWRDSNYDWFSL